MPTAYEGSEAIRDRVFQPLADEVHRLTGFSCFAVARHVIRAAAFGVGVLVIRSYLTPPYPLATVYGWIGMTLLGNLAIRLWRLDRDIREQERRVDRSDGTVRAVWPRFRDDTVQCVMRAAMLWLWLAVVLCMPPHHDVLVAVIHRMVDVVALGGGGIAVMFLSCEARRPPPRATGRRLAAGVA